MNNVEERARDCNGGLDDDSGVKESVVRSSLRLNLEPLSDGADIRIWLSVVVAEFLYSNHDPRIQHGHQFETKFIQTASSFPSSQEADR